MKKIIQYIDKKLFSYRINSIRNLKFASSWLLKESKSDNQNSFIINYKSEDNSFAKLCHKYGSDKGSARNTFGEHILQRETHNYSDFYSFYFSGKENEVLSLFECGIGTNNVALVSNMGSLGLPGASLRVWKDYFPNAEIVGADIDAQCLFQDERISTFEVDQTDPQSIKTMLSRVHIKKFEVIIDDGLHTYEGGRVLFENLIDSLTESGTYIIEDVNPWDIKLFQKYFETKIYNVYYVHLLRKRNSLGDNSLIVIRRHGN
jgi:hypothetical protein